MRKHKLSTDSIPDEFADLFMPFSMNKPDRKKYMVSFELQKQLTNLKATLDNAGPGWVCYHNLHPFYVHKIRQHIGLYVLHGPVPSTRVENNFRPQREDKVLGNYFIYTSFEPNAGRHHRHLKSSFVCQDP